MVSVLICDVIEQAKGDLYELTELVNETSEEKGKEESENSKEVYAFKTDSNDLDASCTDFNDRQTTIFLSHSEFSDIEIALPDLPPEL